MSGERPKMSYIKSIIASTFGLWVPCSFPGPKVQAIFFSNLLAGMAISAGHAFSCDQKVFMSFSGISCIL